MWRFRLRTGRWSSSRMRWETIGVRKVCRRSSSWTCAIAIAFPSSSIMCYRSRRAKWTTSSRFLPTSSTTNPRLCMTRLMLRRSWSRTWSWRNWTSSWRTKWSRTWWRALTVSSSCFSLCPSSWMNPPSCWKRGNKKTAPRRSLRSCSMNLFDCCTTSN